MQYQTLDDFAVGLEAVADVLLRTILGKIAHMNDFRVVYAVEHSGGGGGCSGGSR